LENINQAIAYHDKSLKLTETILKRFENNEIDINYKENFTKKMNCLQQRFAIQWYLARPCLISGQDARTKRSFGIFFKLEVSKKRLEASTFGRNT